MNIIQKIKSFFYNYSLKKTIKDLPSFQREMVNIQDAKSIGVLYNATKPNNIMVVSQFADKLRQDGKQVYILGFQNIKNKEETDARIFNKTNVSAFNIPSDNKVSDFQKIKLDILICAFKEECLPLEYIAATSKAKFRVGAFNKSKTNFYELMINTGNNQDLKYLLQQVLHFLKVINKDEK